MRGVWRKFHIEVDSMVAPTNNNVSGSITKVEEGLFITRVTTNVTLNDSANRFETGTLTQGTGSWQTRGNTAGANFRIDYKKTSTQPALGAFSVVDDDPTGPVGAPNIAHIALAFRKAYIEPVYDGGGNATNDTNTVPFVANMNTLTATEAETVFSRQSPLPSPDYWTVYLLGAFQGLKPEDNDPDSESPKGLGATSPGKGCLIFRETVRDAKVTESWVVAHEVGHYFSGHETDNSLMNPDFNSVSTPYFNPKVLALIRNYHP